MINTPHALALAKRVRDHLTEHPEQHKQANFWRRTDCGTTACIAGWVAILDGVDLEIEPALSGPGASATTLATGEDISHYAGRVLGLTHGEIESLFYDIQDETAALTYLCELIAEAEAEAFTGGGIG